MCKLGDIIVIDKFKNEDGEIISKHSFVVVSDSKGCISGIKYDFVASILCSFHNKEHLNKKLRYKENFLIKEDLISGKNLNNKSGYIKADQLYYFDKKQINYKVIAHMEDELFDELIQLIIDLSKKDKLKNIETNLEKA